MCVSDRMSSHFHSLSSRSLFLRATSIYVHKWRFEIEANYYFAALLLT